jgi:hypothetical protein
MPPNVRRPRPDQETRPAENSPAKSSAGNSTAAAYDRLLDRLRVQGKRYQEGTVQTMAQCPSHEDRQASLAIYRKPGRIKIVCYAGCDDALDILPALGLTLSDLWDQPKTGQCIGQLQPDPAIQARIEARRNMTVVQRAVDDLLQLPDLGERLARCIAVQGGDHE